MQFPFQMVQLKLSLMYWINGFLLILDYQSALILIWERNLNQNSYKNYAASDRNYEESHHQLSPPGHQSCNKRKWGLRELAKSFTNCSGWDRLRFVGTTSYEVLASYTTMHDKRNCQLYDVWKGAEPNTYNHSRSITIQIFQRKEHIAIYLKGWRIHQGKSNTVTQADPKGQPKFVVGDLA